MSSQRRTSRALGIYMAMAILTSTAWVSMPQAKASTASDALTVTAEWFAPNGSRPDGQEITMSGNAPASATCPSTQACHALKATLLSISTPCPATWDSSQGSVTPNMSIDDRSGQMAPSTVPAGPYSRRFSLFRGSYPQIDEPSQYQLCGYLVDSSTPAGSTVGAASTPLDSPTVCPSSDFSIDDAQQTVPFWYHEFDNGSDTEWDGRGTMHVTVPGAGAVTVIQDGSSNTRGITRQFDEAGTHGIDLHDSLLPDTWEKLYESQQSETSHYTVTFRPTVSETCLRDDQTFGEPSVGSQKTTIDWVPAKEPFGRVFGCDWTAELVCHERTLTIKVTKKAWSGTLTEPDGATHCRTKYEQEAKLYKLIKGKERWLGSASLRDGKFATGALSDTFKKHLRAGGTFWAEVRAMYVLENNEEFSKDDYICGATRSPQIKV